MKIKKNMQKRLEKSEPMWTEMAPMKTKRAYFALETLGGKFYAIGGYNESSQTSFVEAYDPITNTWSEKTPMNFKRQALQSAVFNEKIYVFGGGGEHSANGQVAEYDPATDIWTQKAPLPAALVNFGLELINNKFYAIGGYGIGQGHYSSVYEYDPVTNVWGEKASMSERRYGVQTQTVNGKIYAIGGRSSDGNIATSLVEEYNPITNTWITKAPMHTKRGTFNIVQLNGKIYAIGGSGVGNVFLSSVEEYDPKTNVWTEKASLNNAGWGGPSIIIDGKIYIFGGKISANTCKSTVEVYDPETNVWSVIAPLNNARVSHQCALLNNKIYVFGGLGGNSATNYLSSVEAYDVPSANPMLNVTPSADTVRVGQMFTTAISIHNVENIYAEDLKITYDTERFTYVGAAADDGLKLMSESQETEGTLRFVVASAGKENAAVDGKTLLTLSFRAKSVGQGKVDIVKGRIADNAELEIDVEDENCGEATITVEASSDVNRSGTTTLLDLGIDGGYYGMNAADTNSTKHDADVIVDGVIDDADLAAITAALLLNDEYPPNTYN